MPILVFALFSLPLAAGAAAEGNARVVPVPASVGAGAPFAPAPTIAPKGGRIELNVNEDPNIAAQQQAPLTLTDFERLAEIHNPTMIQARAQIKGEQGKALQAGLWFNPDLSYNGDLIGAPTGGLGEFEGGILDQPIILGGKLKLSRRKYLARAEAAKCEALTQAWKVGNDVRVSFYDVVAAREHLKIENELLKSMRDRWLTVNEMFNLGQANEADKHLANVVLEQQKLHVLAAENNLQYKWQLLVTAVGIDIPAHEVTGNLQTDAKPINWQLALQELMANSPELGEAREKLQADYITVKREHHQPIPNLILTGGVGYDQIDGGVVAKANANIANIPIFDRNQGTIQQAEADLTRQKAQVELVQLQLRRILAENFRVYTTAMQHVDAYTKVILPEAQKRYEVMLQSYKDTRSDWPPVLEAQRDFFNLRNEFIDHQLELRVSEVAIKGFVLTGALVAPPGVTPAGHIDATPRPR